MNPSQIARVLPVLIGLKRSVFLKGPVGAGKSSVVHQVGKSMGLEVRDTIRASQMDPTDIKGFPAPDLKKREMFWLKPNFLPTDGEGILFLDELTSGHPTVQAACYQLVLDRRVGDYKLPDGWAVIAAGNREMDGSIVNRSPAALNNRFIHLDFDVVLDDFVNQAMADGISPTTVAFLRFREDLLHKYVKASTEAAFPTPRSWYFADQVLNSGMTMEDTRAVLHGTVGTGAGDEYLAYASLVNTLPTREQIAMDPLGTPIPESPNVQYAAVTMLSMASNSPSNTKAFFPYVERMPVEFQVIFMRDCLAKADKSGIKTLSEWTKWSVANHEVVV